MKNLSRRLITAVLLLAFPLILGGARAAEAQTLTASFIYPTDGATNVSMSTPVQWTAVPGAQVYYLYLGSTLGAFDLANSGELHTTSYTAVNIPAGLVYARLWTVVADVWRYVDISFTAANDSMTLTYPAAGVSSADMTHPFEWTPASGAVAYYLYVGTSVGDNDIVDSGEIQSTQYLAYNLPLNQPINCRLWVFAQGYWRYLDRVITATATATQTAQFIFPTNGMTNADMDQPFQWSTALNAQTYYLYVGTSKGARDLVDAGETTDTSYLALNLPTGQTLYARLWTELIGGNWKYIDITFTAAPATVPTFVYPTNGSVMDISRAFTWTSVPHAQAYQLLVGSTPGSSNVVNTGSISGTSYAANLPTTGTYYARVGAKVGGQWRFSAEIAFSTSPLTASLITPANGSTGFVSATVPFTWTSVPIAEKYYLQVGTTVGGSDLIDSQELCDQATCYGGPLATQWNGLDGGKSPATGLGQIETAETLYARLWTVVGGTWRYVDSTFTTASLIPTILDPLDGSTKISVHPKYTWTFVAQATAYRVTVQLLCDATHACTPDQQNSLLEDSGLIYPTKQDAKAGYMSYQSQKEAPDAKLVVKVYALVGGVWYMAESTYTHRNYF
jgi:hypothetical protein